MKVYCTYHGEHGAAIGSVEAKETPQQYQLPDGVEDRLWQAFGYRQRLHKVYDSKIIHLTPKAAVEAFIAEQVSRRDNASREQAEAAMMVAEGRRLLSTLTASEREVA